MREQLSGSLPSERTRPDGSLVAGIPAVSSAQDAVVQYMVSVSVTRRDSACTYQTVNAWRVNAGTAEADVCLAEARSTPRCKATATRNASSVII